MDNQPLAHSLYVGYSVYMAKNKAAMELGRKGGLVTKKKLGKAFYSKIGKMGRDKQLNEEKKADTK